MLLFDGEASGDASSSSSCSFMAACRAKNCVSANSSGLVFGRTFYSAVRTSGAR